MIRFPLQCPAFHDELSNDISTISATYYVIKQKSAVHESQVLTPVVVKLCVRERQYFQDYIEC
jgi:hypothetical protein